MEYGYDNFILIRFTSIDSSYFLENLATVPWDPYRVKKEISHQREEDWKRRSKSLIRFVSKTFDAKTITWRIMNMPGDSVLVPRHR